MLRTFLADLIRSLIQDLIHSGVLPESVSGLPVEISDPKNPDHGDFACNFALVASKSAGMNPRQLGELLQAGILNLPEIRKTIVDVEVAGPGFLNLRLNPAFTSTYVANVGELGFEGLSKGYKTDSPKKINVEFVSVNPNGPITIGSGRGAAFGSAVCKVLEAVGHRVHREYYINDGVNSEQMRLFAESVRSLVKGQPVPENGYKGDYVVAVAEKVKAENPDAAENDVAWFQQISQHQMLVAQREALTAFGVEFDEWFSEQSLHNSGMVEGCIQNILSNGVADEEPYRTKLKLGKGGKVEEVIKEEQAQDEDDADGSGKTLWLRSTKFGDDMDRVLRRKDGRLTYIASDVAYHRDKFNRPPDADKLITVLGPDHHGYIGRLQAVVASILLRGDSNDETQCAAALALSKERLEVLIFQLVRFLKDGKPAPMRKRDGNIYALLDLLDEIGSKVKPEGTLEDQRTAGRDVSRFFYLMRHHDTTFDFDLDLAQKQSDENPVFYAQYAHARISSILSKATEAGLSPTNDHLGLLTDPRELALIKKIVDLPDEIRRSSEDYGVHRIATFSIELARMYHSFYDGCRVIQVEQPELSQARLALCLATQIGIRAALELLGISAPERMARALVPEAE